MHQGAETALRLGSALNQSEIKICQFNKTWHR